MNHFLSSFIGFMVGVLISMVVLAIMARPQLPPAPILKPATSIKVILHPWKGIPNSATQPIEIPPESMDLVMRMLTPEKYFGGTIYEFVDPIVADVEFAHADGTRTHMVVRENGHNPAVVTVDGRNYFYAKLDPEIHAGGIELMQLVNKIAYEKAKGANATKQGEAIEKTSP